MYVHTSLQYGLQSDLCLMVWYLRGTEVAKTDYLVCINCGTWNRNIFFFTKLNIFFPISINISQSWPTVSSTFTVTVWLCSCTGLLIQHSLTVISINSSLTQCAVGADRKFIYVHAISSQHTRVHIVTHNAIANQNTYPALNTLYHNQK